MLQTHFSKLFTNVVQALAADPARTFLHYEVRYFAQWYKVQAKPIQDTVRALLSNGQLEFANGMWEMYDETCPTYHDMLLSL